jgi:signal transduction histidine kinase
MGPLPRTHGLLGAMLESAESHRARDIRNDPRFRGWWPSRHPDMGSFLGVPIVSKGGVIGAFYLTEKQDAAEFGDEDQQLIEMLAAHAAVAIENARLYERSRELSVIEERNRLARDLHDSAVQTLFSLVLNADAALTMLERDPGEARGQVERLRDLAREAMEELRSLVFELRPAELEAEGLVITLRKHVGVLRRVYRREIELRVDGEPHLEPSRAQEVFTIVREALQNALRHSGACRLAVLLETRDGRLRAVVEDDGAGFDPVEAGMRSKRLGLTSMQERAAALGGTLTIQSRPGAGATISLEVAGGGNDPRPDR